MKKRKYDYNGNLINSDPGYDEMSEQLEFREPKYKKPIDLKLLVYLIVSCILILLLVNIQSCN